MECKVVDDGSRKSKVAVLIETLWNVKHFPQVMSVAHVRMY